jgi:hypothetical protein
MNTKNLVRDKLLGRGGGRARHGLEDDFKMDLTGIGCGLDSSCPGCRLFMGLYKYGAKT